MIKTDVTKLDQLKAVAATADNKFGEVDAPVNNTVWDELMFFTQTTPELLQKLITVNFTSNLCNPPPKIRIDLIEFSHYINRNGELKNETQEIYRKPNIYYFKRKGVKCFNRTRLMP